jgi:hypothetical protein
LIFKYYPMVPFSKRHRSIEMDKSKFHKYNIEKKWLGLVIYLHLYQKTPGGIAKYPPVSLGLVRRKDVRSLRSTLVQLSGRK